MFKFELPYPILPAVIYCGGPVPLEIWNKQWVPLSQTVTLDYSRMQLVFWKFSVLVAVDQDGAQQEAACGKV